MRDKNRQQISKQQPTRKANHQKPNQHVKEKELGRKIKIVSASESSGVKFAEEKEET